MISSAKIAGLLRFPNWNMKNFRLKLHSSEIFEIDNLGRFMLFLVENGEAFCKVVKRIFKLIIALLIQFFFLRPCSIYFLQWFIAIPKVFLISLFLELFNRDFPLTQRKSKTYNYISICLFLRESF